MLEHGFLLSMGKHTPVKPGVFEIDLICLETVLVFPEGAAPAQKLIYLFEDYSLDADRRELRRGAELIAVEPGVFDLLQHLIHYRDRIVSKDDLIEGVWDGRIVSDFDA